MPPQSTDANGSADGGGERDMRAFRESELFDVSGSQDESGDSIASRVRHQPALQLRAGRREQTSDAREL